MADRVVKVTLTAQVAQYVAGMEKASKATRETGSAAEKLAKQGEAFQQVGRGMLAVGAVATTALGLAVAKFAEFDKAMSAVQAATHESAANMGLLRDAALDAGDRTVFSASEAANAIEELAKAGVSTADILNGALDGALDLAAAAGIGVAEAAEIASNTLNQFNLEGGDAARVADLLAAGAGKASGGVSDLGAALAQVGLVANSTGLTIDETTTALAAFASQGLLGSDAGTSFKAMLGALTPNSAKAATEMERLGISAFDAAGEFVGLEAFAGNLDSSLSGLTDQQRQTSLEIIFGSDAVRAATALYNEGADGIAEWTDKVSEQGYAAETARIRLDNLLGDVEKLGGAFDTTFIKTGSSANDSLRALTQGATGVVSAIGDLPEPVLAAGLGLGALAGTVGLVGGAALLAVPKVAEFKVALATLSTSGGAVARGVGGVAGALAIAGTAFALWAANQARATATTAEFLDSLDQTTGAVTDYTRELVAKKLAEADAFKDAGKYGITQSELTDAVIKGGDAMVAVKEKLDASSEGMVGNQARAATLAARYGDASLAAQDLSGILEDSRQNFVDEAAAAEGSAESTGNAAEAYQEAAANASELQSNLQDLIATVNEANGVGQDAVSTNSAYQDALAGVQETIAQAQAGVEGYSTSVDESTEAGSANAAMFAELAAKSQKAAEAQFALDGDTQRYRGTLEAGRQALYDQILGLTGSADAAQALTDKVYAMPTQHEIDIIAETSEAQRRLDAINSSLATFHASKQNLVAYVRTVEGHANGGTVGAVAAMGMASGGTVYGPGTSKSDSILTRLSAGEEVIQEPWASMHRGLLKDINAGRYVTYANHTSYAAPAGPSEDLSRLIASHNLSNQLLREVRDRVGLTVPTGAIQGALGSTNVGVSTRGRA